MPTFNNKVTGSEHAIVGVAEGGIGTHGTSKTSTGAGGVSDSGVGVHGVSTAGPGVRGDADNGVGVFGASKTSTGTGGVSDSGVGVHGISKTGDAVFGASESGRGVVGVGTTASGVEGNSASGAGLFGSSQTGIGVQGKGGRLAGFFEGDVVVTQKLTVAVDIVLSGADCAEDFDVAQAVDPGSVMIVDADGILGLSTAAYDKRVAGVVSGAGSYRPGMVLDKKEESKERLPIGLVGKVYCKVEANSAPIEVGDLLTSSDHPGHAMKACDHNRAFGAVLGKALRPLSSGTGLVPILISLQ
jgi:hypothetical protein